MFTELDLPGVILVKPRRIGDARGYFCETYSRRIFTENGIDAEFVQDNESLSAISGTVRGLHFQTAPFAQAKLVRVIEGAIFDVAVDLRTGSPHYGRWVAATLTASEGEQLFVPRGFGHGFCTLTAHTRVCYKVDNIYSRENDGGVLWNDPAIGVDWPVSDGDAVLSDKDRHLPTLDELANVFAYE